MENPEQATLEIELPQVEYPDHDQYGRMLLEEPEPTDFEVFPPLQVLYIAMAIAFHEAWVKILQKNGWVRTYRFDAEQKRHPFLREYDLLTLSEQTKVLNVFKKFQSPLSVERPDENQSISSPEFPSRRKRTSRSKKTIA